MDIILNEKLNNNLLKLVKCYTKNCKKELKMLKKDRDLWLKNGNKLYNDYKEGKITKEQFEEKIKILDKNYYNSLNNKKNYECHLNKCYNLVKENLELLSKRMNYNLKDKKKYTLEDYIKISVLNQEYNLIK